MQPFEHAWALLKVDLDYTGTYTEGPMRNQETLGNWDPDFPSPYGEVMYVHGTPSQNVPSIMREGLGRRNRGVYVSPEPSVKESYAGRDGKLIGIRTGAGTPEPYWGYDSTGQDVHYDDDDDDDEGRVVDLPRIYPWHWRFPKTVAPEFLVHMPEGDVKPRKLPSFYDAEGNPPDFGDLTLNEYNMEDWHKEHGLQTPTHHHLLTQEEIEDIEDKLELEQRWLKASIKEEWGVDEQEQIKGYIEQLERKLQDNAELKRKLGL